MIYADGTYSNKDLNKSVLREVSGEEIIPLLEGLLPNEELQRMLGYIRLNDKADTYFIHMEDDTIKDIYRLCKVSFTKHVSAGFISKASIIMQSTEMVSVTYILDTP